MVKRQKDQIDDEITQEHQIVPGPAEEAEGTIHPAEEAPGEVLEELPQPEEDSVPLLNDVVDQVLRGEWGVGQDRRLRLQMAGHNPNEVQRELVRRANSR